jgi:hypothetical protein
MRSESAPGDGPLLLLGIVRYYGACGASAASLWCGRKWKAAMKVEGSVLNAAGV